MRNLEAILELLLRLFGRGSVDVAPINAEEIAPGAPGELEPIRDLAPSGQALSPHFTLGEFTESDIATRKGITNAPTPDVLAKLRQTASGMEQVRALLGHPITITSAYRSAALNTAVGGSAKSAHVEGWAVDFKCPAFGSPLEIARAIAASEIFQDVDQLIHEYGRWVHISFDPRKRGQALTISARGTVQGLHAIA